jgi:acyl-CoA thioester hydrolase
MKKQLTYKGAVMTWECDSNGHMNVMYYINKFELGARNFDLGFEIGDSHEGVDVGFIVLEQQIKYLKEVFEDDILYIESSITEIGNKTITYFHEMYHGKTNELVATMKAVAVLFDKTTRKALPLNDHQKALLAELI